MINVLKSIGFASFSFFLLSGFGAKHSTLEALATPEGNKLVLKFVVKPNADMMVTKEGPWSVTLTETKGLKLELKDGKFQSKELNESIPGFEVKTEAEAGSTSGKVDYVVRAFVCSTDKKHCYPQQHKGSLNWSLKS